MLAARNDCTDKKRLLESVLAAKVNSDAGSSYSGQVHRWRLESWFAVQKAWGVPVAVFVQF